MQSERRWQLGDKVKKKRGSSWRGTVCGFYSTPHTPEGYCVDSAFEPGSVQVWPEAALEDWDGVMLEDELRAEITRLTEALRAAEEREKGLREEREELLSQISDCRGSHWLGRQDRKGVTPHLDAIWRGLVEIDDARAALKEQPHDDA